MAPASLNLLTATITDHHERRRALGVWSATAASGAAGGLFLGGLLTDLLGWRWVLFVNVPIGIALVVASFLSLSESAAGPACRRLDLAGAVTVTAGMALVVFGIVSTDSYAWTSPRTIATLAGAVALPVSFIVIEARFAPNPIVPLRTFRRMQKLDSQLDLYHRPQRSFPRRSENRGPRPRSWSTSPPTNHRGR